MNKTTLEKVKNNDEVINDLFYQIENIILKNKTKMVYQINDTLVNTYFYIGKTIV